MDHDHSFCGPSPLMGSAIYDLYSQETGQKIMVRVQVKRKMDHGK
jgi:hypothetical protein